MLFKTVASSAALGWSCVSAGRQSIGLVSKHAVPAVDAIGSLLGEAQGEGFFDVIHRASGEDAFTPGVQETLADRLRELIQNIDGKVQQKIKASQAATQTKVDNAVSAIQDADGAVTAGKQTADAADEKFFKCVAAEQAKRKEAEDAEKSLTASRSNENEACQLQQDNKDFAYAAEKDLGFKCDLSVHGHCEGELGAYKKTLEAIEAEALAALAAEQKKYKALKAACDDQKQLRVKAQSALTSSESAWATQRKTCQGLAASRTTALCAFGSKMQSKCAAEASYQALVAASQKAKGDDDSEPDRAEEWKHAATAKCMLAKAVEKGTDVPVNSADLQACAAEASFGTQVGNLDRKEDVVRKLASSNMCSNRNITFFNGQAWTVPLGAKPKSSEYIRSSFTPVFHLVDDLSTSGNFDFCSAPAPPAPAPAPQPDVVQPDVESRPTTKKKCDIYVGNAGKTLGGESHSVVMALDFTDSKENAHKRQWILNIGQQGTGAEHWLWHPASGGIQMGMWNGPQIGGVDISKAKHTLATVYDASSKTYSLYIDGKLAKTRGDFTLNIKNSVLSAGDKQGYHNEANFNGCVSGVDLYYSALTAEQVHAASAKLQAI